MKAFKYTQDRAIRILMCRACTSGSLVAGKVWRLLVDAEMEPDDAVARALYDEALSLVLTHLDNK